METVIVLEAALESDHVPFSLLRSHTRSSAEIRVGECEKPPYLLVSLNMFEIPVKGEVTAAG